MKWLKKVFGSQKDKIINHDLGKELSIDEFIKLPADKRMMKVVACGNTGDLKYYPLLKYCILNDSSRDVKFSALKRIHLFKNDPDCLSMLNDLENRLNTQSLESYYSMALSKTGIISLEDFEIRINNIK